MLLFNTTASGATASSERMRITADGYVTIGTYTGVPASLVTVTSKSLSMDQLELQSMRAPISGGNVIGGISFRSNDTNFTTP